MVTRLLWAVIIRAGLTIADSCTTSTISLQAQPTNDAGQISLEITGCSNNISSFPNLHTVARVNLYRNSFSELNLAALHITDQIHIADNPNLERLVLPDPRPGQTISLPPTGTDAPAWTDVEIVDNPRLSTDGIVYQGSSANFWAWGARNLSSFVLSGGNFHSDFFYPSAGQPDMSHVYVTTSLVVNSTDPTYDCGYLNALRYNGLFKGNYTCQGRTVEPSSPAYSLSSSRNSLLGVLAAMVCFVNLL